MLICLDLDGTIISPSIDSRGHHYHDWSVLAGRRQRLAGLLAEGHIIGVVTNQAAAAFGLITEDDFSKKMTAVLAALKLPRDTPILVCFAHPRATSPELQYRDPEQLARRIPSGAMLREMMQLYPEAAAQGVIYVGDKAEDRQAAEDASVEFVWAETFFEETGDHQSIMPRRQAESKGLARFDQDELVIVISEGSSSEYRIDLKQCTDAAKMLDAILQLARKAWCTPDILFDVLLCIEEASKKVHGSTAQNVFCPLGQVRSVIWK
jgi:D-glycero-D-manno-heptose 1,7-bisphosphate phosphatase